MNVRTVAVPAVVALALLAGVSARRLSARPPTDEQKIRALFEDAARAAGERRIGDAVAGVSERFSGEGLDRHGVKQLVGMQALRGEWVAVAISGAEVRVDGDSARAVVDAVLARAAGRGKSLAALLPDEGTAHRFDCALEREDGEWRVVRATWRPISLGDALAGPPRP